MAGMQESILGLGAHDSPSRFAMTLFLALTVCLYVEGYTHWNRLRTLQQASSVLGTVEGTKLTSAESQLTLERLRQAVLDRTTKLISSSDQPVPTLNGLAGVVGALPWTILALVLLCWKEWAAGLTLVCIGFVGGVLTAFLPTNDHTIRYVIYPGMFHVSILLGILRDHCKRR